MSNAAVIGSIALLCIGWTLAHVGWLWALRRFRKWRHARRDIAEQLKRLYPTAPQ